MDVVGEALISFSELCICLRVVPPKLPRFYPPYPKGFKHSGSAPASSRDASKEWRLQEFLHRYVCMCVCVTLTGSSPQITRAGYNHTFIGIYGIHMVLLARKSPYIRSYTVLIYGSGQPYL